MRLKFIPDEIQSSSESNDNSDSSNETVPNLEYNSMPMRRRGRGVLFRGERGGRPVRGEAFRAREGAFRGKRSSGLEESRRVGNIYRGREYSEIEANSN